MARTTGPADVANLPQRIHGNGKDRKFSRRLPEYFRSRDPSSTANIRGSSLLAACPAALPGALARWRAAGQRVANGEGGSSGSPSYREFRASVAKPGQTPSSQGRRSKVMAAGVAVVRENEGHLRSIIEDGENVTSLWSILRAVCRPSLFAVFPTTLTENE